MALDYNALRFLSWARSLEVRFENTLTLGRQNIACSPKQLRSISPDAPVETYCESVLRSLGARQVDSVDYSGFENATIVHDLNRPFDEKLKAQYDVVLDGGTLEHIFNYPQAIKNCMELVKPGGHFITIAPANNFMGHGFYQLSPELFHRVFSHENGFELRTIVIHDFFKQGATFYEVQDIGKTGQRVELRSNRPMQLCVLARRAEVRAIFDSPPQQSDYVLAWSVPAGAAVHNPRSLRSRINPYLPQWLKNVKRKVEWRLKHGAPTLANKRFFKKLNMETKKTFIYIPLDAPKRIPDRKELVPH